MTGLLKEFQEECRKAAGFAPKDGKRCVKCRDSFHSANVFTPAGARETQISGLCERCWDKMFTTD